MDIEVKILVHVDDDSIQNRIDNGYTRKSIISEIVKQTTNHFVLVDEVEIINYKEVK